MMKMNILNKKWYYFLNSNNQSLFHREGVDKDNYIICYNIKIKDKINRLYTYFNSYVDFLKYIKNIPEDKWNFFEIILGEVNQKLYFDIDIDKESNVDDDKLLNNITSSIDKIFNQLNIFDHHTIIFQSNGKIKGNKRSYHIIVDGYCVENNESNKILSTMIRDIMNEEFKEYIDTSVYKKIQQLRLYKSRKVGTDRIKLVLKMKDKNFNCDDEYKDIMLNNYIFFSSSITVTNHCSIIPIKIKKENRQIIDEGQYINDVSLDKIINNNLFNELMKVYKLYEVKDNKLILHRISPSLCIVCNREHSSDNAFITIDKNNYVKFHCWRNPIKGYTILNLNPKTVSKLPSTNRLSLLNRLSKIE